MSSLGSFVLTCSPSVPGQEIVTIITPGDSPIISAVMPAETTVSATEEDEEVYETTNVEVIIDEDDLLIGPEGPEPKRQKLDGTATVILSGTDPLGKW